jgi:hypothetical protein
VDFAAPTAAAPWPRVHRRLPTLGPLPWPKTIHQKMATQVLITDKL